MFAVTGKAWIAHEGAGPPGVGADVLLVHAGVADRRSWQPLVPLLHERHRVVSYDARGYGETTCEPEPHAPAEDALSVMDKTEMGRAVVIGNSVGGRTAIELALTHPDRVSGLVLIGSAVGGAPDPDLAGESIVSLFRRSTEAAEAGDNETANYLNAQIWLDGPTSPEGRVGADTRELFLVMNGHAMSLPDPGEELTIDDAWSRLAEIDVPTLVMVGDLDLPDLQAISEGLAERLPNGEFVRLAGVAHLPVLEGDPECLQRITDFVNALDPDTPTAANSDI